MFRLKDLANYLPLSGGTVTGKVTFNDASFPNATTIANARIGDVGHGKLDGCSKYKLLHKACICTASEHIRADSAERPP